MDLIIIIYIYIYIPNASASECSSAKATRTHELSLILTQSPDIFLMGITKHQFWYAKIFWALIAKAEFSVLVEPHSASLGLSLIQQLLVPKGTTFTGLRSGFRQRRWVT